MCESCLVGTHSLTNAHTDINTSLQNHTLLSTHIYTSIRTGTDEKRQYTPRLVMLNKTKPLMCVIQLSVGNLTAAAIVDTAHVVDHGANDGNAGDSVCKLAVSTTTTSNDSSNSGMATRNELSSAVYSWGNGTFGILGHGDSKHRPVAREIKALAGKGVRRIHFGSAHAACVTSKGELYTWGYGGSGCLGHGNRADRSIPTLVTFSRTQGRRKQEHKHKNARTTERTSHGNSDTTQKQKQEQKRSDSDDGGRKDAVTIGDADVIGAVAGVNKNNKDSDEDNEQYEDEHSVFITDVHCSVGMPTFEVAGKNRSAVKGKEQPHTLACSADGRAWSWYV